MGLFDIFKKKKDDTPEYDVTNLSVKDLRKGFIIEYDMKTWEIIEEYEYDWGNNNFSKEYLLDSGDKKCFLDVEDDGDLFITVSKPVKVFKIDETIPDAVAKNQKPPSKVVYKDKTYYLESDSAGYFHDITKGTDDWEELISWDYFTEDENEIISITQWDENSFEASEGRVIKEFEISNIIPGSSN